MTSQTEKNASIGHIWSVFHLDAMMEVERAIDIHGLQSIPDGTGGDYAADIANDFRDEVDRRSADGTSVWKYVLLEEVYEALAETEYGPLRKELLQVITVAAKWIDDLDRRQKAELHAEFRNDIELAGRASARSHELVPA